MNKGEKREYNMRSNLVKLTSPASEDFAELVWTTEYDDKGNPTKATASDGTVMEGDAAGNLGKVTCPDGTVY